jgi:hypothetical protein
VIVRINEDGFMQGSFRNARARVASLASRRAAPKYGAAPARRPSRRTFSGAPEALAGE